MNPELPHHPALPASLTACVNLFFFDSSSLRSFASISKSTNSFTNGWAVYATERARVSNLASPILRAVLSPRKPSLTGEFNLLQGIGARIGLLGSPVSPKSPTCRELQTDRATLRVQRPSLQVRRSRLRVRRRTQQTQRRTLWVRRPTLRTRRSSLQVRRPPLRARRRTPQMRRSSLQV